MSLFVRMASWPERDSHACRFAYTHRPSPNNVTLVGPNQGLLIHFSHAAPNSKLLLKAHPSTASTSFSSKPGFHHASSRLQPTPLLTRFPGVKRARQLAENPLCLLTTHRLARLPSCVPQAPASLPLNQQDFFGPESILKRERSSELTLNSRGTMQPQGSTLSQPVQRRNRRLCITS
ncbi:hypothetical protein LZ31DRAFT_344771 [Colletotrichum somersetense]|nr:hypothetical protein LZ31DRAFT_344771 [Colletotrichum somersetense]